MALFECENFWSYQGSLPAYRETLHAVFNRPGMPKSYYPRRQTCCIWQKWKRGSTGDDMDGISLSRQECSSDLVSGLLLDTWRPGSLIGLGLGFVATALLPFASRGPDEPKSQCCRYGNRWIQGIIGAFFVIVGAAIVWEPGNFWTYIWPYGVGAFFIFLGLVFIARMAWRSG